MLNDQRLDDTRAKEEKVFRTSSLILESVEAGSRPSRDPEIDRAEFPITPAATSGNLSTG
jgi:hypothetical protein